jgi:hypothetical protein
VVVAIGGGTYFYVTNLTPQNISDNKADNPKISEMSNKTESQDLVKPKYKTYTISDQTTTDSVKVRLSSGNDVEIPVYSKDDVHSADIADINFDGYEDVMITQQAGAYNESTSLYVYDQKTDTFGPYLTFPSNTETGLASVQFDSQKRKLTSFFKGRGVGDIYNLETYTFISGKWQLLSVENRDIIRSDSQYYILTVVSYVDGQETSKKNTYYKYDFDTEEFVDVDKSEALKN